MTKNPARGARKRQARNELYNAVRDIRMRRTVDRHNIDACSVSALQGEDAAPHQSTVMSHHGRGDWTGREAGQATAGSGPGQTGDNELLTLWSRQQELKCGSRISTRDRERARASLGGSRLHRQHAALEDVTSKETNSSPTKQGNSCADRRPRGGDRSRGGGDYSRQPSACVSKRAPAPSRMSRSSRDLYRGRGRGGLATSCLDRQTVVASHVLRPPS